MANPLGVSDAQYQAILAGARSARNDIATTGKIQPVTATPSVPGSAVKTADQYVPYISANKDPNGGNTTEYRAPRAGDTGIGVTPPSPTPTPQTIAQPVSAQQTMQPPKDYAALAAARTALALQQKQTIANQQKASAQSAYDQQNLRTKDDRVLGDFSRTQVASPFSNMGRKSFQEGLIGRERTQADADASSALATQKGNIDQLLADYQNATADEQVRIADELERADKQYQLQLSQLSGQLPDGGQTLAAKSQDQNYGLNLAGLTGNINGQQSLQSQSQQFNQNLATKQLERGNFESDRSYNLAKSSQDWTQTFQKEQYSDQKAQQIWDNTFKDKSFTQSMNDAAASRGLQWASLNQRDKEFVADQAFKEKNFTADQEQRKIDNLKSGASAEVNKEIDGLYTGLTSGQITGSAAIQEIDGKVNAGILSKADADRMKSVITTVTASLPNVRPALTQDQIDSNGGNNPQDLNQAQLEKLWSTDPTGEKAGRPRIDWASWYTDPRGKVGGISYEAWKKAYGPQLTK